MKKDNQKLPYKKPKIIYHGKITIRACSEMSGRLGPITVPGQPLGCD